MELPNSFNVLTINGAVVTDIKKCPICNKDKIFITPIDVYHESEDGELSQECQAAISSFKHEI